MSRVSSNLSGQVYSCEYGNFLCNTEREAVELMIKDRAPSLWTSVDERRDFFSNPLYHATETHDIAVLVPSTHPARITLWTTCVFLFFSPFCLLCDVSAGITSGMFPRLPQKNASTEKCG